MAQQKCVTVVSDVISEKGKIFDRQNFLDKRMYCIEWFILLSDGQ